MNVSDLRDLLEGYEGDVEVRLATQPSWPLQYYINGVVDEIEATVKCTVCKGAGEDLDEKECKTCYGSGEETRYTDAGDHKICWITEGGQLNGEGMDSPYCPSGII